jgi:hypothetical protein
MSASMFELPPHLRAAHKPIRCRVSERRHMLLCLIPKIQHILSEEKRHAPLLPWRRFKNTTNERLERVIQGISEFYLKNLAKSLK